MCLHSFSLSLPIPLKKTNSARKKKRTPAFIIPAPVSFCCSMLNALHKRILNEISAMPVAIIIAANMPRNKIRTSNRIYLSTGYSKRPAANIFSSMKRLNLISITAASMECGSIQNIKENIMKTSMDNPQYRFVLLLLNQFHPQKNPSKSIAGN